MDLLGGILILRVDSTHVGALDSDLIHQLPNYSQLSSGFKAKLIYIGNFTESHTGVFTVGVGIRDFQSPHY